MANNCQSRKCSERCQVRHDCVLDTPASQSLAPGRDLGRISKNQDFMDPAFLLPYSDTYPSQLEVQEDEVVQVCSKSILAGDTAIATNRGAIVEISTPRDINYQNEPSYTPITRPRGEQLYSPPRTNTAYGDQAQSPLAVWEIQEPGEEPFSYVGEVFVKYALRRQDKDSEGTSRGGKRMRLSSGRSAAL